MSEALMPALWPSTPLGRLFKRETREPHSSSGVVTAFRDGQVMLRSRRRTEGFTEALQESGYQGIKAGDLVIHAMDGFAGAIGVAQDSGKSSPVYSALTPRAATSACPKFYAYVLRNYARSGLIQSFAQGVRERSTDFRWSTAKTVPVPVPGIRTQRAIADYLDHETAEIDAFIADVTRLAELTDERLKAVIQHFSTPSHGRAVPLRHLAHVQLGKMLQTSSSNGQSTPYLRAANIQEWGDLTHENDTKYMTASVSERMNLTLVEGDVVVVEGGAGYGKSAFMSRDLPGWIFQNHVFRVRPTMGLTDGRYLHYALLARKFDGTFDTRVTQATIQTLSSANLASIVIDYVPFDDQVRIAERINREIERGRNLASELSRFVNLARERRAALISAAVTGQIDVTKLHKPVAEVLENEVRETV